MGSSERAHERFETALRPLRFAARRDFANLAVVRDLGATVTRNLSSIGSELPEDLQGRVEGLLELFDGFDEASPELRRSKAEAALRLVDSAAGPLFAAAPTPPPRTPSALPLAPGLPSSPPSDPGLSSPQGSDETMSAAASEPPDTAVLQGIFEAGPRPPELPREPSKTALERAQPGHLLRRVQGVPPKMAERLAERRVFTVQDALLFLPRRYEQAAKPTTIERLRAGDRAVVRGVVAASAMRYAGRKRYWEMAIRDGTGTLSCRFFRFSKRSFESSYPVGTRLEVAGAVTLFGAQKQMAHPQLRRVSDDRAPQTEGYPQALYPELPNLSASVVTRVMQRLVEATVERVHDPLPASIRTRNSLSPLADVLRDAHGPNGQGAVEKVRVRLAFDELFYLQLALGSARGRREREDGLAQNVGAGWRPLAERALPFKPTGAQARVLDEIEGDLRAPHPMRRLLQGDVGSGKTAVAWMAAALTHAAGRQSALLAPTEILAEQHARSAWSILAKLGIHAALITGSTPTKARSAAVRALRGRGLHVLIGTHALLEPDISFADLGLVIIDEQHRFGVEQRARLLGQRSDVPPDVLLMTATPIPRTLTLSLYGDLRVSVIDELPPGRSPTQTQVYERAAGRTVYRQVRAAIEQGRQAYVVFPLVEASEQLDLQSATDALTSIRAEFSPHRVELLHGRMRADEKSAVMRAFAQGDIAILVSTTVIEVGVDVPNATVMVVEDADRFGLSQLHQLRGRVGRGKYPGSCYLIASEAHASGRLAVMAATNDGFEIAERDLELRGPGEILGTRQSGLPDLFLANLVGDRALLEKAKEEAQRILGTDPQLESVDHQSIRFELARRFGDRWARLGAG